MLDSVSGWSSLPKDIFLRETARPGVLGSLSLIIKKKSKGFGVFFS